MSKRAAKNDSDDNDTGDDGNRKHLCKESTNECPDIDNVLTAQEENRDESQANMDPPLLTYGETILKLSQLGRTKDNNIENKIDEINNKNKFYDPPKSLISALDVMHKRAETTLETTKQLHEFVLLKQKDKKLKMANQNVPELILPHGYSATIHDVKIDGRGPDDKVYKKHPDIMKWIMRGNTLLRLQHNDIEQYYDVVIYGHKKFTGGVGDEDEAQPENDDSWRSYCLEDPDTADKVVAMDKLNGEAAHFSGRYIGGKFFIVTGSKNVHMLVHKMEDIERYEGDRYQVAKAVARTVLSELSKISTLSRQILYSLLHHTKMTAVCELLQPDNQHIVNLEYLGQQPSLHVITFTPCISSEPERACSLTALPPNHALDLATTLGLKATNYRIITTDKVKHLRDECRSEMEFEGYVLYFIKACGGLDNTIGIAKTKTAWYIMLRALREKAVYCFTSAKKSRDWDLQDRIRSAKKRFNEIHNWLKFTQQYFEEWTALAEAFHIWLNEEINQNREKGSFIRPKFPTLWGRFCAETDNKLTVKYTCVVNDEEYVNKRTKEIKPIDLNWRQ